MVFNTLLHRLSTVDSSLLNQLPAADSSQLHQVSTAESSLFHQLSIVESSLLQQLSTIDNVLLHQLSFKIIFIFKDFLSLKLQLVQYFINYLLLIAHHLAESSLLHQLTAPDSSLCYQESLLLLVHLLHELSTA